MRRSDDVNESGVQRLDAGHCPKCERRGFVIGPKGGLNINIECANLDCRERYNVAFFSGRVQHAQRIPKRSEGGIAWPSEPSK